jgi:hypothetical protein
VADTQRPSPVTALLLKEWGEQAAAEEFEVWVPDPVMWELAEHAAAWW